MTLLGRECRKRFWALAGVVCASSLALGGGVQAAQAAVTPGFDDPASLFSFFYDCHPAQNPCPGHAQVSDVPSPSQDGDALKINYESGNPAYMGADAYIRLGTDDAATRYQVNYDFYFPSRAPIQALEFCMNNYIKNKRYQWAMQWENIGSRAPQWRLWNGSSCRAVGVSGNNINAGKWYPLTIDGTSSTARCTTWTSSFTAPRTRSRSTPSPPPRRRVTGWWRPSRQTGTRTPIHICSTSTTPTSTGSNLPGTSGRPSPPRRWPA